MSTKVKGEAIKEGSISFETLNIELQNNITATPDLASVIKTLTDKIAELETKINEITETTND